MYIITRRRREYLQKGGSDKRIVIRSLHGSFCAADTSQVIKRGTMRWAEHFARTVKTRNTYKNLVA